MVVDSTLHIILLDGDCLVKYSWSTVSSTGRQTIFKVKNRTDANPFSTCCRAASYMMNDVYCPSLLVFAEPQDAILAVLTEDTLRLWNISCDMAVDAAMYSEETDLFYLSSQDKSGFFKVCGRQ